MNLLENIEKQNKSFIIAIGYIIIGVLGIIDTLTGKELDFSLFYVIPILIVTWHTGLGLGIVFSLISALVWLLSDVLSGNVTLLSIYAWNTLTRLGFFLTIAFLLSRLLTVLEHEREIAHKDYLTGALNSLFFYNVLQMEINRSLRYKNLFTIAYIDLDNIKTVNDEFGHATGDEVLCFVVNQIKNSLRKVDVVARLGGDEFALLMPETNQKSAQVVLSKLQHNILAGMQKNNWPVTLSIGVLTCIDTPPTANEAIKKVDDLMYSVKKSSKNNIKYATYEN
ncbi:MAG TPA: diguanylate cyclase [Smithella sp.]|nr:diguanylate cyclase [Smithella sp.]HOO34681.1 diguanylate cyclase [Smithella sp.]HPK22765.1 diguanylate cyclase [Smithella sp.]HPR14375.1 diguanylate cyclase [Smithella sp.]